jgi:alkylation response protein AidB-like acyl-CoA dehydrogenase
MRVTDLDDDGVAFRKSVEQMVASRLDPLIAGTPQEPLGKDTMTELIGLVARTGYFGTRIPAADGGTGLPRVLAGVLLEALPAFLGVSCVSQEATAYRLYLSAPPHLRDRYLPALMAGELLAGTAVSEPATGSDSHHPQARFVRDGDEITVVGSKLWTTNGSVADLLIVVGRDETTGTVQRLLVDTRQTEVGAHEIPMTGLRRGHLCEVDVRGRVPAGNLLDRSAVRADQALARSWTMNRVCMAILALSVARRAIAYAISYARDRQQFGRKIGELQLVQSLIADAATAVEAGRLLCYRALSALDDGVESTLLSSMAKLFGTETAIQAVIKAQQVAGSFGVSSESPFDEWYRDVRMFTFPDGTSQIQQLIIGRELLGLSAF